LLNKYKIEKIARHEIAQHGIHHIRYFTTPTPMNTWLWYVVAEDTAGFHTAYISLFDTKALDHFNLFRRNDSLLKPLLHQEDVQALLRFSQGYYTVESWKAGRPLHLETERDTLQGVQTQGGDTLVFNVLRFEQMKGWENGRNRFVFHYFLERPGDNMVILQRGRFAGWDRQTVSAFIKRIRGN
jgi:inner membrane protein